MARLPLEGRSATNSREPYCPRQFDIIHLQCNPQMGREMADKHYAFVLSPERYNSITRLCVLCPITSKAKGYPFEVAIPDGGRIAGVVLADQIKSMEWSQRSSEFVEACPDLAAPVLGRVKALLGT
jgi:mRNA interferase MazF